MFTDVIIIKYFLCSMAAISLNQYFYVIFPRSVCTPISYITDKLFTLADLRLKTNSVKSGCDPSQFPYKGRRFYNIKKYDIDKGAVKLHSKTASDTT